MAAEVGTDGHSGAWKDGDTRELPVDVLQAIQIQGRYHEITIDRQGSVTNHVLLVGGYDSYSQVYELNGTRWKILTHTSLPAGRTIYTLLSQE
jgi:hypothetical protein